MTNAEKYKEKILKIVNEENDTVAATERGVEKCQETLCQECKFYDASWCGKARTNWMYEEYKEPKKKGRLSPRAYHFLRSLPKDTEIKISSNIFHMKTKTDELNIGYFDNPFVPYVGVCDQEWYKVADLLKWEVIKDE